MFILFQFSFIAFSNIVYTCTSTELTGVCSNGSDGSRLECCENYRAVGNSCKECWPGTHGVDCRDYCPPNLYGRLCSKKCGCEPCDKVTGCLNATERDQNTSSIKSTSWEDESPTNSATWLTLSVLASCFVFCFIFCLRIFCKITTILYLLNTTNRIVLSENRRRSGSLMSRTFDSFPTNDTETSYTELDRSK
ncbi:uncharacterized protein LOC128180629 [Crassostrea angulata]|uniref:uncharacterized protein LOC128180629 n=1 Tax=Magallana angulata TaxID=2784310 RepID=UPI0022B20867|nr:uncharacterized protein LOC128180629 [Crassostrea angulata]